MKKRGCDLYSGGIGRNKEVFIDSRKSRKTSPVNKRRVSWFAEYKVVIQSNGGNC